MMSGRETSDPVQVATDGACLGNPGPGGWAWTTGAIDGSGGGATVSARGHESIRTSLMRSP
jgi:ribonuclease HI